MSSESSSPLLSNTPSFPEEPIQNPHSSDDEKGPTNPPLEREERVRMKTEEAQRKMAAMRDRAEKYLAVAREKYHHKIRENEQRLESTDEPVFQKQDEMFQVPNIHERIDCLLNHVGASGDEQLDNLRRIVKLKSQAGR